MFSRSHLESVYLLCWAALGAFVGGFLVFVWGM